VKTTVFDEILIRALCSANSSNEVGGYKFAQRFPIRELVNKEAGTAALVRRK
jgi:hypothetical protein